MTNNALCCNYTRFQYVFEVTELNSSFSLSRNKHGTKKYIWNRPVEETKKMKCYKRLIYKQFVQVSGLCGPQFLS